MDAHVYTIGGLFQKNIRYKIPFFQRRYEWKKEQWERFAEDMDSLLDDNKKYFLGSLILKEDILNDQDRNENVGEKYIVIDGQQRLTTLFIYMKLLLTRIDDVDEFKRSYCRHKELNQPILDHNSDDIAPFREVLICESFREIEQNNNSNIVQAHNFFFNYFNEKYADDTERIRLLFERIEANVNFVRITLNTNENNEQQIFDTINNLGVDLDTAELLKNFLFRSQEDEASYRREDGWKSMFDSDEAQKFWKRETEKSRQAIKKENKNIEQFLNAYVRIKMWEFKDRLSEQQRKSFAKLANTYDTCKAFVDIFNVSKQDLANEIIEYARLFKKHFVMDKLDEPINPYYCIERIIYIILATKKFTLVPYVLYLLKNVNDQNELDNISKYLESYIIRRILSKSDDKNYTDLFGESLILNKINTANSLREYIEQKDSHLALAMPSLFDIKTGMCTKRTNEETVKLVYYLYEVQHKNNINVGYNDFLAIDLMPVRVANTGWTTCQTEDLEVVRKARCKTFGNYFLIKEETKSGWKKAKTKTQKIAHLYNQNRELESNRMIEDLELHQAIRDWTSDSIDKRNIFMAEAFNNFWEI